MVCDSPEAEQEPLFWFTQEEKSSLASFADEQTGERRLWHVAVVPRVTIDRQTSASQIWFFGQVIFYQGAGLWCAIRYNDASLRPRVKACLRLLGDSGLGGERGAEFGLFDLNSSGNEPLSEADGAEYRVTLSPCCPDTRQDEKPVRRVLCLQATASAWMGRTPEAGSLRRKSV